LREPTLNETRLRKPAPPLLDKLATPQKNTLYSFHFARARFFLLLMKRVFFCGVLPSKYSGRWRDWPHFDLAREKRNSSPLFFRFSFAQTEREQKQAGKNSFPPTPFLFARLLGLRPQNFWTDGRRDRKERKRSSKSTCPTLPCACFWISTPFSLHKFSNI